MKTLLLLLVSGLLTSCSDTHLSSNSWLASAAIAAVVSALVSGLISIYIKDKEYKNDFYKKVIDKRLKALEAVEVLISMFNSNYTLETERNEYKPAHTFFIEDVSPDIYDEAFNNTAKYTIWLTDGTGDVLREFCDRLSDMRRIHADSTEIEKESLAINNFDEIEDFREKLEKCIRIDMSSLHKVDKFFKLKKSTV